MKRMLCLFLSVIFILTTTGCGSPKIKNDEDTSTTNLENTDGKQTNDEYAYTATLDLYPDIMISAKSREALDEVLDILLDTGVSINLDDDKSSNTNDSSNVSDNATTNNSVTNESNDINEKVELNNTETKIFYLLKQSLDKFPNPSSVKVVKFHAYQSKEDRYYLTLTSENSFGGNLTDIYTLDSDGAYGSTYSESQLRNMSTVLGLTKPSCDISKINKALEQYYSEQGW